MQTSVSGVVRWSLVMCFALLQLILFLVSSISSRIDLVLIGDHMNATNHWPDGCGNIVIQLEGEAAFRSCRHHSMAGNYSLGTFDYTTSPDHCHKLIWQPYGRAALHVGWPIYTRDYAYKLSSVRSVRPIRVIER
ncbi:hypothetical protein DFJ58DRAFT_42207 [Suillus subalutaceus]|uniref:uncharacterized protein n=1 Tax=Suillus subalutaceus TaxID=48586 RepID=UPI001B86ACBE|nr:uncharacterized protein DFJ58DRAFT_42207 [Suillus subalutaceus]KAG1870168.1 hypothetical protein DFJ58DRAFT_42207 [Suillus subalutaceus]